jgi:hypothetical protein
MKTDTRAFRPPDERFGTPALPAKLGWAERHRYLCRKPGKTPRTDSADCPYEIARRILRRQGEARTPPDLSTTAAAQCSVSRYAIRVARSASSFRPG